MYLISDLYAEYIKSTYKLIIKRQIVQLENRLRI